MLNKKGQMEIMGIAIVVILVSLGLLFALTIAFKKAPIGEETAQVKESIIAANFINTMRGTTITECFGNTVEALLQDCALGATITCSNGKDSCTEAPEIIKEMLEGTLAKWGKKYYFVITESSQPIAGTPIANTANSAPCTGEREMKEVPMPVRPGFEIKIRLEICR